MHDLVSFAEILRTGGGYGIAAVLGFVIWWMQKKHDREQARNEKKRDDMEARLYEMLSRQVQVTTESTNLMRQQSELLNKFIEFRSRGR